MKVKISNSKRLDILGNDNSFSNRENLTAVLKQWWQKLGYYSMFTALPAIFTSLAQDARAEETKTPEVSVAGRTAGLFNRLSKSCRNPSLLRVQSNYLLPHQKNQNNLAGGDNCPGTAIPPGTYSAAAPFTDSGSTAGANNTVNIAGYIDYCYYSYSAAGPDQIYSFTLTGRGSNPQIQVSTTSATYKPMIYVLDGNSAGSCPVGTGNYICRMHIVSYAENAGGTVVLDRFQMRVLPLNVPLYLFIDSSITGANDSGPYTVRMQDVGIAPAPAPPLIPNFDFDGDGKADISVFRPSDGTWHLNRTSQGNHSAQFGLSTDTLVPADYDGDNKTDLAVFRNGTWYWLKSSNGAFQTFRFGAAGDIPLPADYTGDAMADFIVYRGGVWYRTNIWDPQLNTIQFGLPTDKPMVADFDGDGNADIAVYRDGTWYLAQSNQGFAAIQFGSPTDKIVPADYDGDHKTDLAVYRDGTWYVQRSSQGFTAFQFGAASDIPAPTDYDGDGRADAAVYRDGVWYLQQTTNGFAAVQFGVTNDKPVPSAFLP